MANRILQIETPSLPLATDVYSKHHFSQKDNVLRLFFNRLLGTLRDLLSVNDGGRYLYFPRGVFYSLANQSAAVINTPYVISFENTYITNGVSIADNSKITVSSDGVYTFAVAAQMNHASASLANVFLWFRVNGSDVAGSTQKHGINKYIEVSRTFSLQLSAGDYVEFMWAAADTNISLVHESATTFCPAVYSALASVSYVSNS